MPVRTVSQLLVLCLVLLLAGCTAGAPMSSPMPPPASAPPAVTADLSTSCSRITASAQATQYAGWPPAETFELIPIPVSTELAVGPNRFLLNLLDSRNEPLASPDRAVELRFFNLARDPAEPAASVATTYLPTVESLPGLYRAEIEFPCWGEWGLEALAVEADGSQRTGRMVFPVRPTTTTPPIGAQAPATETPTATTPDEIAAISTDTEPDPDFYTTSIEQALESDQPFLVIFSTPAFCRTRTCGPALDIVKSVAAAFSDEVSFIHVEPYQLATVDGQLQPVLSEQNQPVAIPAVTEWGLPTEPYIFVVDADGRVSAKLEGVASADEIREALNAVVERN